MKLVNMLSFTDYFALFIVMCTFKNNSVNALDIGKRNLTELANTDATHHSLNVAVLDNIGQVALKMVQNIAAAEDEKVDMDAVSEFVIALSKATVMMLYPQIPQMKDIKAEINTVKEDAQKEKENLEEIIETLVEEKLQQRLQQFEERDRFIEQRFNESASNIRKLIDLSNAKKVGFTASSTNSQQYQSGVIFKFENVHVNQGNHYDPSLSIFICPLTGLYMVSVTLTSYTTNSINAYLLLDGTRKLHFYSYGSSYNYNSVAESGLVKCNAGSKFWVQSNNSGRLYGGMYTMFTGYLYETVE